MAQPQVLSAPSLSTRRSTKVPGWLQVLGWLLIALPILLFGLVWQQYAINIPKWDDHALRAFLVYSDQETTLSGKIYQLFRQHNEHRIVYDRIITALDYWLFGKLNYKHLMVVGNLSLVGLLAVFIGVLRQHRKTVLYAVPVSLLLFNLSQWENMFWGMAALQNFSVVLWVVAAFYFLTYTHRWGLALVAAILATLTSGNGLIVWPIGFVLLALRLASYSRESKSATKWSEQFQPLIGWTVGALIVVGLYFTGFEKPADITYVRPGPLALLKGWFAVIGAAAEALPFGSPLRTSILLGGPMTVVTLGISVWGFIVYWPTISQVVLRILKPKTTVYKASLPIPSLLLFFWGCAGFILGTAAVVAWARTGFGAELLITSRYKMYSLVLLILLYLFTVVNLPNRTSNWAGLLGGVGSLALAWLSYYSFLDETIWWRHWMTTNQFNWLYPTNQPVAKLDSITQHYTDLAPAFYEAALPILYGPAQQPADSVMLNKTAAGFSAQSMTAPALGLVDAGTYLLLRSSQRVYLFPAWQAQTSPRQARFWPANQFKAGLKGMVFPNELKAGTYQLFELRVTATNQLTLHSTGQQIVSTGQPTDAAKKNW
jgi:hypothetical protein